MYIKNQIKAQNCCFNKKDSKNKAAIEDEL